MSQSKIIFVTGPTASGKSSLAMQLARQERGTIINADSMQVYSGLPILSAHPPLEDQAEIPHKLYGVFAPSERSSAGRWVALAQAAIRETVQEGRTPILAGGTGLYIRTLVQGIAEIPSIPDSVRAEALGLYDEWGEEKFRRELAQLDPVSAERLARNDRQRLVRAVEVARHTGMALSEWQKTGVRDQGLEKKDYVQIPDYRPLPPECHLLMPPREELYAKCDQRFLAMMEQGAVEEVQRFRKLNIDPTLPAAKTIGAHELADFLDGKISREEAIRKSQQATRNYAKRQMTWFRNQKLPFDSSSVKSPTSAS